AATGVQRRALTPVAPHRDGIRRRNPGQRTTAPLLPLQRPRLRRYPGSVETPGSFHARCRPRPRAPLRPLPAARPRGRARRDAPLALRVRPLLERGSDRAADTPPALEPRRPCPSVRGPLPDRAPRKLLVVAGRGRLPGVRHLALLVPHLPGPSRPQASVPRCAGRRREGVPRVDAELRARRVRPPG